MEAAIKPAKQCCTVQLADWTLSNQKPQDITIQQRAVWYKVTKKLILCAVSCCGLFLLQVFESSPCDASRYDNIQLHLIGNALSCVAVHRSVMQPCSYTDCFAANICRVMRLCGSLLTVTKTSHLWASPTKQNYSLSNAVLANRCPPSEWRKIKPLEHIQSQSAFAQKMHIVNDIQALWAANSNNSYWILWYAQLPRDELWIKKHASKYPVILFENDPPITPNFHNNIKPCKSNWKERSQQRLIAFILALDTEQ